MSVLPSNSMLDEQLDQQLDQLPEQTWIDQYGWRHATNGYARPPWRIYRAFLSQLTVAGKTLELGCGNGLLLRFLGDYRPRKDQACSYEPFGVDLNRDAIEEARECIFPQRPDAFAQGDLRDEVPFALQFDLVLANPLNADQGYYEQVDGKIPKLYLDGRIETFVQKCWDVLKPGGVLFLWCYDGHVTEIAEYMYQLRTILNNFDVGFVEKDVGPVRSWRSLPKPDPGQGGVAPPV